MIDDIIAINSLIHEYFKGLQGKFNECDMRAWHPQGRISYVRNGSLNVIPQIVWNELNAETLPFSGELSCELVSIDITGNVAMCKVVVLIRKEKFVERYTDYLTLVKIHNDWSFINKSFYAEVNRCAVN